MIDTIIKTKNYGNIKILSEGTKYNYYKVMFLNTGHIDEFRKDAVIKGEVRDKYAITLCGVGIIGDIKTRGKYKPYYTLWRNMITRCYDGNNLAYFKKVTVCERWKTFEYFYEDIKKIDGWDEQKFENGLIVLDKDIKQRFSDSKIYSINTCAWISKSQKAPIQDGQQNLFVGISPNGNSFISSNITQFAREHNLERKQISAVLHKRFKSTLGWKFYYLKDIDKEIV